MAALARRRWPARMQLLRTRALFEWFRIGSLLRFGRVRPIDTSVGRLTVRSDDFRAFVLARMPALQQDTLRVWCELARRGPDLCVDIGANYGEFTAAIDSLNLPVLAVEANRQLAACLRSTFASRPNVTVADIALSDRDGQLTFYANPRYSGSASMFERVAADSLVFWRQSRRTRAEQIPTQRLDTLVRNIYGNMPRSVLLKIDVEGAEHQVLTGAAGMLSGCDWWRAVVEWSPVAVSRSGVPIDAAWAVYRHRPGAIIGAASGSCDLGELPVAPPDRKCDVLIGCGEIQATARSRFLAS